MEQICSRVITLLLPSKQSMLEGKRRVCFFCENPTVTILLRERVENVKFSLIVLSTIGVVFLYYEVNTVARFCSFLIFPEGETIIIYLESFYRMDIPQEHFLVFFQQQYQNCLHWVLLLSAFEKSSWLEFEVFFFHQKNH